jgi:hypothetical protein
MTAALATLDPVFLSRKQFGFVISFHIIFPPFTIGLAAWLATIEGVRLATRNFGKSHTSLQFYSDLLREKRLTASSGPTFCGREAPMLRARA